MQSNKLYVQMPYEEINLGAVGKDRRNGENKTRSRTNASSGYGSTAEDSGTSRNRRKRRGKKSFGSKCWWFCCGGWKTCCGSCLESIGNRIMGRIEKKSRTVVLGKESATQKFPANVIRNQKYNIITFIPLVLFNQFKFFLNLYFLVVALSQFVPEMKIGYLYTYWGPLGFVLAVTMCREAYDDFLRYRRDKELNSTMYSKLTKRGVTRVPSSAIKVSDLIIVEKDQRVPADMIFLRTSEKTGSCFLRTDQLDGETDWKLRLTVTPCQRLPTDQDLLNISASVYAEKPQKDIHNFIGTFTRYDGERTEIPLSIENTLWANTVVASGTALGVVVYTGVETRSVMNTSNPESKIGLIDLELNNLTKVLFIATILLSLVMIALKGFNGPWYRYFFRFILLFSYIIPLSLRVSLDMGKVVYSWMIAHDKEIKGTVVRSSTIPEELGRIGYLLTDKTGTLTQNEMVFKRLHLGTVSFGEDSMDEVKVHLQNAYSQGAKKAATSVSKVRRTIVSRVQEALKAIVLCHNVTPVADNGDRRATRVDSAASDDSELQIFSAPDSERTPRRKSEITYQASSPDENGQ